jgi:hypothetical protein
VDGRSSIVDNARRAAELLVFRDSTPTTDHRRGMPNPGTRQYLQFLAIPFGDTSFDLQRFAGSTFFIRRSSAVDGEVRLAGAATLARHQVDGRCLWSSS